MYILIDSHILYPIVQLSGFDELTILTILSILTIYYWGLRMKTVTATELKTKTGETLEAAQREPVTIEKNGRPIAVIVAQADYERLMKLENAYWLARVEAAENGDYIGTEATTAFFKEMLKGNAETRPE